MQKKIIVIVLSLLGLSSVFLAHLIYNNDKNANRITLFGNVDIRQVNLSFRVPGRVNEMYVEEGDFVKKGALISRLDREPYSVQLKGVTAELEAAKANFKNAVKIFNRRKELVVDGSVSQEDLDTATAAKEFHFFTLKKAEAALSIAQNNLEYTAIYAPTEGTILTRIREPGSVVATGEPIYTLSITDPVWVRAYIREEQLGLIYPGMKAAIFTDTPGKKPYLGQVGFISPTAEFTPKSVETAQLRTDLVYRIRIYAENPDHSLRQGMPVTVELELESVAVD